MLKLIKYYSPILMLFLMICSSSESKRILYTYHTKDPKYNWALADSIFFDNPQESDNTVTVKTLWNTDSLFFHFSIKDHDLRAYQQEKDHPLLYLDDMIEILFDANNDKNACWSIDDIVYHINLLGQKKDDRGTIDCTSDPKWDGDAHYTIHLQGTLNDTTDTDIGYQMELSISWNELGLLPVNGLSIGINFANGDNDGCGRQLFNWSGANPMRSPYTFGTIILKGKHY